jgi:hypothetical protein
MVFQIDRGNQGNVTLDGLSFAVLGNSPDVMGKGNWAVGLVIDDRATPEQQQAITTIASGQAGGPPDPDRRYRQVSWRRNPSDSDSKEWPASIRKHSYIARPDL